MEELSINTEIKTVPNVTSSQEIFDFNGIEVRTAIINNEPYFCLKDVCCVLGLEQSSRVKERLNEDGVTTSKVIDNLGRNQQAVFINESNLYKVIFQSRKQEAEKFQDWVTGTVLPTIRKHGAFMTTNVLEEAINNPDMMIGLLQTLKNEQEQRKILELQAEHDKPKVDFYNAVSDSKTAIPMDQVAKVLDIYGLGRNKLFEVLRNKGILQKNNIPYQTYVDRGYFRVIESKYTKPNGETNISIKTLVYQKGIEYIRKQLSNKCN